MRFFMWLYALRWGSKRISIRAHRHMCGDQSPHSAHRVHIKRDYGPCSDHWCEGVK